MQEKPTSFSIKHWSDDDKPREKMVQKGKSILSDSELIAILIGSGSRNESAVELSKRILASVDNNLNELGKLSIKQLMQFKGIGEAKSVTIAAALEIGRRRRGEEAQKIIKITRLKLEHKCYRYEARYINFNDPPLRLHFFGRGDFFQVFFFNCRGPNPQ